MSTAMLALFQSKEVRDAALEKVSKDGNIELSLSGEAHLYLSGRPSDAPKTAFIIFTAKNPMDAFSFMQAGASSCGQI